MVPIPCSLRLPANVACGTLSFYREADTHYPEMRSR
jgi:hypothetical protein